MSSEDKIIFSCLFMPFSHTHPGSILFHCLVCPDKYDFSKKGDKMIIKTDIIHHVVMGADLNHHGTLFAGQGAKWFVEAGFIAAANLTTPKNVVCVNIHGMLFKNPVPKGTILRYESKVVFSGKTRMIVYIKVVKSKNDEFVVDGFISFVHIDAKGCPTPHGITIEAVTEEDIALQRRAEALHT
ncbi:MAG: hotdog domain-containing protein [Pseudomonadota bacterium]